MPRALKDPAILRFLVVGCTNTAVSFVVFLLAMAWLPAALPWRAGLAQAVSYLAGMAWGYALSRLWSFRDSNRPGGSLARYAASQIGFLLLSSLLLHAAVDRLHAPKQAAWLATMAGITLLNYLTLRHWVFPKRVPTTAEF